MSYAQTARLLGVHPHTVSDLVRGLGITPHDHPGSTRRKGLDHSQINRLRRALGQQAQARWRRKQSAALV